MSEPENRSKLIREWTTGLLLPIAIFLYTYQKDESDKRSRELDRITTIIRSLGSNSPDERSLARAYIKYLADHKEAPPEVSDFLVASIATAPKEESAATVRTLEAVQQNARAKSPQVSDLKFPPRLYVHIRSESDRATAEGARQIASGAGVAVPGIQLVGIGPSHSQIRFFHAEDQPKAQELAEQLSRSGIPTVAQDTQALAKKINASVPLGQLELWLAPGVKFKDGM